MFYIFTQYIKNVILTQCIKNVIMHNVLCVKHMCLSYRKWCEKSLTVSESAFLIYNYPYIIQYGSMIVQHW